MVINVFVLISVLKSKIKQRIFNSDKVIYKNKISIKKNYFTSYKIYFTGYLFTSKFVGIVFVTSIVLSHVITELLIILSKFLLSLQLHDIEFQI